MSREVYIASDYAGMNAGLAKFYYGYEETLNDEWCFVARLNGKETHRIPASKLAPTSDSYDCGVMLLHGIATILEEEIFRYQEEAKAH